MNAAMPVLVSELAAELGTHHVSTLRDLKRRGFALGRTKTPSGQWAASLTRTDADRYVAARERERTIVQPRLRSNPPQT
jgi:hypothetical protein